MSYHKQEMQRDLTRQRRNEKAPLADRKAAAADWFQRLTEYPETLTRCVEFILNGSCGHAPQYEAQKIIIKSSRKTATARLGQMVASVEDQCCAAGARRSFRKLTQEQQETANGFILQAINDWADAGGTWTRQG